MKSKWNNLNQCCWRTSLINKKNSNTQKSKNQKKIKINWKIFYFILLLQKKKKKKKKQFKFVLFILRKRETHKRNKQTVKKKKTLRTEISNVAVSLSLLEAFFAKNARCMVRCRARDLLQLRTSRRANMMLLVFQKFQKSTHNHGIEIFLFHLELHSQKLFNIYL